MALSKIATTLIQATNIVLLLRNSDSDVRKVVIWRIDKDEPEQVLNGLQIANANVEDSLKLFEHPLETGAVITDHMVIEPQQVSTEAYISNDDANTLKQLEYFHLNGIPLKMRVNNKVIPRVVLKDKPFALSAEIFDKTKYSISFREEEEVEPVYVAMPPRKVRTKSNASRVNSGVKQAQPAPRKKSWLQSLFKGGRT